LIARTTILAVAKTFTTLRFLGLLGFALQADEENSGAWNSNSPSDSALS